MVGLSFDKDLRGVCQVASRYLNILQFLASPLSAHTILLLEAITCIKQVPTNCLDERSNDLLEALIYVVIPAFKASTKPQLSHDAIKNYEAI
jgi:hypothetical protein